MRLLSKDNLLNILFILSISAGLPLLLLYCQLAPRNEPFLYLKFVAFCSLIWGYFCYRNKNIAGFIAFQKKAIFVEFTFFAILFSQLLPEELKSLSVSFGVVVTITTIFSRQYLYKVINTFSVGLLVFFLGWMRGYESFFGKPGFDAYLSMFQTNYMEAADYILRYFNFEVFGYLILYLSWVFWLRGLLCYSNRLIKKHGLDWKIVTTGLFLFVLGLFFATEPLAKRKQNFMDSYAFYQNELVLQQQIKSKILAGQAGKEPGQIQFNFDGNLIVVIGESTSRHHMALYGYHRATTPRLAARKMNLLVQKDTVSTQSHTVRSIPDILNFQALSCSIHSSSCPVDFISALKSGGFETYWLSNQKEFGLHDNLISVIAKTTGQYKFLNKAFSKFTNGNVYDHDLLPLLKESLDSSDSPKVIFVHIQATHVDYCRTIPETFRNILDINQGLGPAYFGNFEDNSDSVNCYDNAIRYVDYILGQIIDRAQSLERPTAVVYLPDHGEHPADGSGHNSAKHSAYHVEIPHVWYLNSAAAEMFPEKFSAFFENSERAFSTIDFYHTAMDFLQADTEYFEETRSLFSESYEERERQIMCVQGVCTNYDDPNSKGKKDLLERARSSLQFLRGQSPAYYQKLWAHRVNTLGKLIEAKGLFAGVEADVVFDSDQREFYVFHPPAKNIGLALGQYLLAMKDRPKLKIWLDWKNANQKNIDLALIRLEELDNIFNLNQRTVIETGSNAVFSDLKKIGSLGFNHSYYVPVSSVSECIDKEDWSACDTLSRGIQKHAATTGANYISYPFKNRSFFEQYTERFAPFGKLTWNLNIRLEGAQLLQNLGDIDEFDGYLVDFRSIYNH